MVNPAFPEIRRMFLKKFAVLLWIASLLMGCRDTFLPPKAESDPPKPAMANDLTPSMTRTRVIRPTSTPQPSITPAPLTPIPTVLPSVTIGQPAKWPATFESIISELNDQQSAWQWHIGPVESADILLLPDDAGLAAFQEPLAVVVPFTTDWQEISLVDAQTILAEGHDLVKVIPWSALSPDQRALRVNGQLPPDTGYPLTQSWSLHPAPGFEEAANELSGKLGSTLADPIIHIVAVGDIMLDRSLGYAIERGDLTYPFAKVARQLQHGDITVGNLESALGDIGEPVYKSYPFRAPPGAAESLAMAGFDVLSVANNHAQDYGPEAFQQGIGLLQEQGIAVIGGGANAQEAHAPAIIEAGGLNIAFLAYVNVPVEARSGFDTETWTATDSTPGLAWAYPEAIEADIKGLPSTVDRVVVVLHSGFEYVISPSEPQITAAKTAIDAGADLVIGHHAHILQGIEFYKSGVIIYGTANFAFEIDGPPETALFHIWLDGQGVRQIEIQPAIVQFGGQPRLAESWEAKPILDQIHYQTRLLNGE